MEADMENSYVKNIKRRPWPSENSHLLIFSYDKSDYSTLCYEALETPPYNNGLASVGVKGICSFRK